MKEISSQSLHKIRDVIQGQNYANIKARLDQLLPTEYSSMFAKVNISGERAYWFGEDSVDYMPYSSASAVEKEEIATALEECRKYACDTLGIEMPFIDKAFIVPSKDEISWYRDESGNTRVMLSQWGFRKRQEAGDVDIIGILINEPRTLTQDEVTVNFLYSDGLPAADCPFMLDVFNNRKECRSDEGGNYYLGKMYAGKKFAIESMDVTQRFDFTVIVGGKYEVTFPYEVPYKVVVNNQHGAVKPDFEIVVDSQTVKTDENGEFQSEKVLLTKDRKVQVSLPGQENPMEYALQRDEEQNVFVYTVQDEEVLPPPPPPPVKYVRVRLLDFDGLPLPGIPFKILVKGGSSIDCTTNADGAALIPAEAMTDKKKYKVSFQITPEQREAINRSKPVNNNNNPNNSSTHGQA